jgi:phosphate transport system protein
MADSQETDMMTTTTNKHTVSAFDEEMERIRGYISEMGSRAHDQLVDAMRALDENDLELAKRASQADKQIDALEKEVEQLIVETIALRAPMADDLRGLVAAMKMSGVIERIGDYAKNIARRVRKLESRSFVTTNDQIPRMAKIAAEMVRAVMDAYARRDTDLALQVCERDKEVDIIFKELFVDLVAHIAKHPEAAQETAHLLVVTKNIERIGDHATTCAEMIYFTETGERID